MLSVSAYMRGSPGFHQDQYVQWSQPGGGGDLLGERLEQWNLCKWNTVQNCPASNNWNLHNLEPKFYLCGHWSVSLQHLLLFRDSDRCQEQAVLPRLQHWPHLLLPGPQ